MTTIIESRPWGAVRSTHRTLRKLVWQVVDRALGVRTTSVEPPGLPEQQDRWTGATPCPWLTLVRVFSWLKIGKEDVLVDFGSGSGRVVLVASLFPFGRIEGVERVRWLHHRALNNLARFRLRPRAPVELVCADAIDYCLRDDATVVFLYNPFDGATFRQVMENVFASVDRSPRRLRIVYVNPQEHEYLVGRRRCRHVKTLMGHLRPTREWARMLAAHVYEVEPPGAAVSDQERLNLPPAHGCPPNGTGRSRRRS